MATAAAEIMLTCALDGSISMYDMEIERRPYHRNCSCALHKSKAACSNSCLQSRRNISFTKKKSWNECSMSLAASKFSHQSSFLRNSSSAVRNKDDETEALSGR